jgi:hypothetical protein
LLAITLGWSLNTRELDMNKTEEWNGKSFAVLKWNLFGFLFFALQTKDKALRPLRVTCS